MTFSFFTKAQDNAMRTFHLCTKKLFFRYVCFTFLVSVVVVFKISLNMALLLRPIQECDVSRTSGPGNDVFPRIVHQIFYGADTATMPSRFNVTSKKWIKHAEQFSLKYILWNSSMVDNLVHTKYPWLFRTYSGYSHWVRRVDVAKYVILHAFGGVYVDLDIRPTSSNIEDVFHVGNNNTDAIAYETQPFGIGGDFIITKPGSNFISDVLCGLDSADITWLLPYVTTMMSTGPGYLTVRQQTLRDKAGLHVLSSKALEAFISHVRGATWHQADGKIIWWTFTHRDYIITGLAWTCAILLLLTVVITIFLELMHFKAFSNMVTNISLKMRNVFQRFYFIVICNKNKKTLFFMQKVRNMRVEILE